MGLLAHRRVIRVQVISVSAGSAEPLALLRGKPEAIQRIVFNPAAPENLLLCAQSWALRLRLGADAHPSLKRGMSQRESTNPEVCIYVYVYIYLYIYGERAGHSASV